MDVERSRRASALFDELLEVTPELRSARLAERCGDDRELARAVDELLRAGHVEDELMGFLDAGAFETGAGDASDGAGGPPPGTRVANYELKRVIAVGGMGTVFEAVQDRPRRSVALKMLRRGLRSAAALERFRYESELLARLRHPGIAQVYEAGTYLEKTPAGPLERPWFAMELVEGARDVRAWAREVQPGLRPMLALFTEICDAVHHGHRLGVIHRDLKPGNVLIDAHGRPKVIDYGIARSLDRLEGGADAAAGSTAPFLGTLQYMSPEQLAPGGADADVRSDVYSLGALLHELLCGCPPHDLAGLSPADARARVSGGRPSPKLRRPDLPAELDWILCCALEGDPDRRYDTVGSLAADLRRFLLHEPVLAAPPGLAYRARKFARRHRWGLLAGAGLVLASAGTTAGMLRARAAEQRALQALGLAERRSQDLLRAARRNEAIGAFLEEMLSSARPDEEGRDARVVDVLDVAAQRAEHAFASEPEVRTAVRLALGSTYRTLRLLPEAEVELRKALAAGAATDALERVPVLSELAQVLLEAGRFDEADRLLAEGLDLAQGKLERADERSLRLRRRLGELRREQGRYEEAEALLLEVLELERAASGGQGGIVTGNTLAGVYDKSGRPELAEDLLRSLLDSARAEVGEDDARTLLVRSNLAQVLLRVGKLDEALPLLERDVGDQARAHGERSEAALLARANLGRYHHLRGNHAQALSELGPAHAGLCALLGESHSLTLNIGDLLAIVLAAAGRVAEAEPLLRASYELRQDTYPADHPDLVIAAHNLASALGDLGRFDEADPLWDEAVARARGGAPRGYEPEVLLQEQGAAALRAGDFLGAEEALLEALELVRAVPGAETPRTLAELLRGLYRALGQEAEAERLLAEG